MIPKLHKDFIENSIEILKEDKRIVGLATGGSYITGEMDEYSDVDLIIAVDDKHFIEVMNERIKIAEGLGQLLSSFTGEHVGEPRLLICLYGPECLHVDLKFVSLKDIGKRVEEPCILWEKESCMTDKLKTGQAIFPTPDMQWFEDRFWIWVHYGATKIGRGEIFETIEFISFLRQMVLGPMILMEKDHLPKGVRKIEFMAPDRMAILKETIPTHDKKECIKSLYTAIELYKELREGFVSDDYVPRAEAEQYAMAYLDRISQGID